MKKYIICDWYSDQKVQCNYCPNIQEQQINPLLPDVPVLCPLNHQKNIGFVIFSWGMDRVHWAVMC